MSIQCPYVHLFHADQFYCVILISRNTKSSVFNGSIKHVFRRKFCHDEEIADLHTLRIPIARQQFVNHIAHCLVIAVNIVSLDVLIRFFIIEVPLDDILQTFVFPIPNTELTAYPSFSSLVIGI